MQMRGLHVGLIGLGQGLGSGAGVLGAMAYERISARTGTVSRDNLLYNYCIKIIIIYMIGHSEYGAALPACRSPFCPPAP
jgi:hypothetical protein